MSKLAEIKEYLERLQAMADDDGETWDLSPNDRIAIRGVLQRCEELEKGLDRTHSNFKRLLAGKPVRDASETLAEAERLLKGGE